jgi:hypothetical protein
MNREKLQEATISKLLESQTENKIFEEQLDKIWDELVDKLETLNMKGKQFNNFGDNKHHITLSTEPVEVADGVSRYVEISAFYAIPSFPAWHYYIGAEILKVEENENEEVRWGLLSQGYTSKEEVRDARIAVSTESGNVKNLGNTVDEFIVAVEKAIRDIQDGKYEPNTIIMDEE